MALEELKSAYGDDGTLEKWFGNLKNTETPKQIDEGLKNSTYSQESINDVTKKDKNVDIPRFTPENGYTTKYTSPVEIKKTFEGLGTKYTSDVEIERFNPENGYATKYTSDVEINNFHKGIGTKFTQDYIKNESPVINESFGDGLARKDS